MWQNKLTHNGFAVVPEILGNQEVTSLLSSLSSVSLLRTRAGMRNALGVKVVEDLANDPRLVAIAREVTGGDPLPFRATLFDKSPSANWLVAWHQDTLLPLKERRRIAGWGPWSIKQGVAYARAPEAALQRVVALRVHLDDSTLENGPLRVLPGTHKLGVLSNDSIQEAAASRIPNECVVARGGILVMRPLIVHSSSKCRTRSARRVLHIEYASSIAIAKGLELARA